MHTNSLAPGRLSAYSVDQRLAAFPLQLLVKMFGYEQDRLGLDGFRHDSDGTCLLGFLCNVATSGDYNDRNLSKKRILGSFGEKTPSIEYRHHKVQENHRWRIL